MWYICNIICLRSRWNHRLCPASGTGKRRAPSSTSTPPSTMRSSRRWSGPKFPRRCSRRWLPPRARYCNTRQAPHWVREDVPHTRSSGADILTAFWCQCHDMLLYRKRNYFGSGFSHKIFSLFPLWSLSMAWKNGLYSISQTYSVTIILSEKDFI